MSDFTNQYVERLHFDGILGYFDAKTDAFRKKIVDSKSFRDFVREQLEFEKDIIEKNRLCVGATSKLSNLHREVLYQKLTREFYNSTFMEEMRCIINLILDSTGAGGHLSERERIAEYIRGSKRFGAPSVNGYALRSTISDRPDRYVGDLIVMKCPQNPEKSNELIHEVAVGSVLNKLRSLIPNFSYVYDVFSCSSPLVDPKNKEVLLWCTTDRNAVAYAIYENINDSLPLIEWSSPYKLGSKTSGLRKLQPTIESNKLKANEFLLYYLQILFGLNVANIECDFTHYDLHNENVLIRSYAEKPFYIEYPYQKSKLYLLTPGGIATIIDYGMSHVKIDERDVGIIDNNGFFSTLDTYANQSNIITDAYKLLGFTMFEALKTNNSFLFRVLARILSLFYQPPNSRRFAELTIKEAEIIILDQRDFYYYLPMTTEFNIPLSKLIERINVVYREEFPEFADLFIMFEKPENTFGCNDLCPTREESIKEIGFGITKIPTFFEVYDGRNSGDKEILIRNLLSHFEASYQNELQELYPYLTFKPEAFNMILRRRSPEETVMFLKNNETMLVQGIDNVAKVVNAYVELTYHKTYISYLLSIAELKTYRDQLDELNSKITMQSRRLREKLQNVYTDVDMGKRILGDYKDSKNESLLDLYNRYNNVYTSMQGFNLQAI
jgi:hypothetical protein